MSLFFDLDKRLRSFSYEGSKPIGPVEIDWEACAQLGINQDNLTYYFYPTEAGYVELVRGLAPSSVGSGWDIYGTEKGQVLDAGTESVKYTNSSISSGLAGATEMTSIAHTYITGTTGGTSSVWRHDGSFTPLQIDSTGRARAILWVSGLKLATTPYNFNGNERTWTCISSDWATGGDFDVYVNGDLSATRAGVSGSVASTTKDFAIGGTETNSEDALGAPGLCITVSKKLTADARRVLERNPYFILKPKTQHSFYYPVASGATFTLSADPGSYAYTGTAATLEFNRVLSADSGSYTYTGTSATLEFNRVLSANAGSYTYTGTDAALTYTPATGDDYTLVASSGSFTYTGLDATLAFNRALIADSGSYAYTGVDANLVYTAGPDFTLAADSGSYTYTGLAADFKYDRVLGAGVGSYTYAGLNVNLVYSADLWIAQADTSATWTPQTDNLSTWTEQ